MGFVVGMAPKLPAFTRKNKKFRLLTEKLLSCQHTSPKIKVSKGQSKCAMMTYVIEYLKQILVTSRGIIFF